MLGLFIAIFLFILGIVAYKTGFFSEGLSTFLMIVGICAIFVCMFAPLNGFEEPELISEVELNSFYEQDGKDIYAIKLDYNQVAITYTEKEYVYGNEHDIVHNEAVYAKIIEDKNCEMPVKQTYRKRPKKSILCLGQYMITVEATIIVVPEGSVRK